MRRVDYMRSIMTQLGKLSTDALRYLSTWSMPLGVIPILRDYENGKLMRDVDCDMQVALALEEITRCRDCACFDDEGEFGQWCTQLDFGKKEIEDGFCAWAVRRDAR